MENLRPEGIEYEYVTSPSEEDLVRNVYVRLSNPIRKSPQRYDPGFGAGKEWNIDAFSRSLYIICDGYCNINVDKDKVLPLLTELDAPSTIHMREYYSLKYQSHDPDTPM